MSPRAADWERRLHGPVIAAAVAALPLLALSPTHPHGTLRTVEVAGHWPVWATSAVEVTIMPTSSSTRRAPARPSRRQL